VKKTAQFRKLLASPQLEFLLEAHNGISARIGEEAGFKALWAGGLCLSAQYGVRDNNEASWTQVLEMLEFMSDATSIPILLDGDTGYGNFNNVRRLVRKLEQRGIAAVCIEDKLFPKTNSFIDGDKQQLSDIDEFCSRIRAGKDAQGDDDFAIITRIEAFIAGWGLDEALKRAEAYHAAGSDGILIHSALTRPTEVLAFKKEWGDRLPVVIVPTKYHSTPTDVFREAGFSLAIWANHMLRAAVTAMQGTAGTIAREQNLRSVEDRIAPVKELFRLQGASELQEAEERYLPKKPVRSRALILAASRGAELGELTAERPKTMVKVRGRPLLSHIVSAYNAAGIKRIQVVRGYRAGSIDLPSLSYADNAEYADSGELLSLAKGLAGDPDDSMDLFVSYGDVIFNHYILDALNETNEAFAIAVDTDWRESANRGRVADYVSCTQPHSRRNFYQQVYLEAAGENLAEDRIHGEWMGFLKVAAGSLPKFRTAAAALAAGPANRQAKMLTVLAELMRQGERIRVIYTTGHWLDVDSLEDVLAASEFG
jgi:phosphoenolpyruvate phosphomutase